MYIYVYFNKCMQTSILKHCIEIMYLNWYSDAFTKFRWIIFCN